LNNIIKSTNIKLLSPISNGEKGPLTVLIVCVIRQWWY